ncbi:hypothetical protein VCR4J2_60048 [Vibrio coralliirubri]|nr:hypothetical protein VCR4J2_60048 [Vibrio coralliirubri]
MSRLTKPSGYRDFYKVKKDNIHSPSLMDSPVSEGKGQYHRNNIHNSHPVWVLEACDISHIHRTTDKRWLASFLLFCFHKTDKLSQILR